MGKDPVSAKDLYNIFGVIEAFIALFVWIFTDEEWPPPRRPKPTVERRHLRVIYALLFRGATLERSGKRFLVRTVREEETVSETMVETLRERGYLDAALRPTSSAEARFWDRLWRVGMPVESPSVAQRRVLELLRAGARLHRGKNPPYVLRLGEVEETVSSSTVDALRRKKWLTHHLLLSKRGRDALWIADARMIHRERHWGREP